MMDLFVIVEITNKRNLEGVPSEEPLLAAAILLDLIAVAKITKSPSKVF